MSGGRLSSLPPVRLALSGLNARCARGFHARLVGLTWLRTPPAEGLILPRTRSVHTVGMRFALDLVWLDDAGRALRVDCDVAPRRLRACRGARAVLEVPAGATPAIRALRPGDQVLAG